MSDKSKTNLIQSTDSDSSQMDHRFNILPHPAKSNNPADLVDKGGSLLGSNPAVMAHHARDPHIPSQEVLNGLEAPLSREDLRKRAKELNK